MSVIFAIAAVVVTACTTQGGEWSGEGWARKLFQEAQNREKKKYYGDAVGLYEQVIEQVPGSELAKRAQQRIDQLRATPELVREEAERAQRKRKQAEAQQTAKARLEEYVQAHPGYRDAILNHRITLGMSQDDVIASWGKPEHVNTTVTAYGRHEQWIYGRQYVYFENGRVSSWQSSE